MRIESSFPPSLLSTTLTRAKPEGGVAFKKRFFRQPKCRGNKGENNSQLNQRPAFPHHVHLLHTSYLPLFPSISPPAKMPRIRPSSMITPARCCSSGCCTCRNAVTALFAGGVTPRRRAQCLGGDRASALGGRGVDVLEGVCLLQTPCSSLRPTVSACFLIVFSKFSCRPPLETHAHARTHVASTHVGRVAPAEARRSLTVCCTSHWRQQRVPSWRKRGSPQSEGRGRRRGRPYQQRLSDVEGPYRRL